MGRYARKNKARQQRVRRPGLTCVQKPRQAGDGSEPQRDPRDYQANAIVRENVAFEAYYRLQGVVPEDEFAEFMACMKTGLPSTFRVTGNRQYAARPAAALDGV